jgi:hypothetical protein
VRVLAELGASALDRISELKQGRCCGPRPWHAYDFPAVETSEIVRGAAARVLPIEASVGQAFPRYILVDDGGAMRNPT